MRQIGKENRIFHHWFLRLERGEKIRLLATRGRNEEAFCFFRMTLYTRHDKWLSCVVPKSLGCFRENCDRFTLESCFDTAETVFPCKLTFYFLNIKHLPFSVFLKFYNLFSRNCIDFFACDKQLLGCPCLFSKSYWDFHTSSGQKIPQNLLYWWQAGNEKNPSSIFGLWTNILNIYISMVSGWPDILDRGERSQSFPAERCLYLHAEFVESTFRTPLNFGYAQFKRKREEKPKISILTLPITLIRSSKTLQINSWKNVTGVKKRHIIFLFTICSDIFSFLMKSFLRIEKRRRKSSHSDEIHFSHVAVYDLALRVKLNRRNFQGVQITFGGQERERWGRSPWVNKSLFRISLPLSSFPNPCVDDFLKGRGGFWIALPGTRLQSMGSEIRVKQEFWEAHFYEQAQSFWGKCYF